MSKSLGNGIDPIEIIDEYSTDALRFSLIMGITAGNDIRYVPEKLDSAKNFANKLWNASKFALMNLEGYDDEEIEVINGIIGCNNFNTSHNTLFIVYCATFLVFACLEFLKKMGYAEEIQIKNDKTGIQNNALSILTDGMEVYIPIEELVNPEEEKNRLEEEKKKVQSEIERANKMFSNPGYIYLLQKSILFFCYLLHSYLLLDFLCLLLSLLISL